MNKNAKNKLFNRHISTNSLLIVEIHMGPTKFCGSHQIMFVARDKLCLLESMFITLLETE